MVRFLNLLHVHHKSLSISLCLSAWVINYLEGFMFYFLVFYFLFNIIWDVVVVVVVVGDKNQTKPNKQKLVLSTLEEN